MICYFYADAAGPVLAHPLSGLLPTTRCLVSTSSVRHSGILSQSQSNADERHDFRPAKVVPRQGQNV
jgi:hypothetical protein